MLGGYTAHILDEDMAFSPIDYAEHMVQTIQNDNMRSSYSYANKMYVDEDGKSHYACTCYGFMEHVLERAQPFALEVLRTLQTRYLSDLPSSFDGKILPFHLIALGTYFSKSLSPWQVIHPIQDIQRGDMIAYMNHGYTLSKEPPPLSKSMGTHVMFVADVVDVMNNDGGVSILLGIIDATGRPHNRHDSRYKDKGRGIKNSIGKSSVKLTYTCDTQKHYLQWSNRGQKHEKVISILRFYRDD